MDAAGLRAVERLLAACGPLDAREACFIWTRTGARARYRAAHLVRAAAGGSPPGRIDLGAAYATAPARGAPIAENFLQFDIDASDCAARRCACAGTKAACAACWPWVAGTADALARVLERDVGIAGGGGGALVTFTGGRGVHLRYCSAAARRLDDAARGALARHLDAPAGRRALWGAFVAAGHWARFLDAQAPWLRTAADWRALLAPLAGGEHAAALGVCDDRNMLWAAAGTPSARWALLARTYPRAAEALGAHVGPRIDAAVTAQRAHLLRCPFTRHERTGEWCVPVVGGVRGVADVDPQRAATAADLAAGREVVDAATARIRDEGGGGTRW